MTQPRQRRASSGEPIDPVMGIEAFVFRRENGIEDRPRHLVERELVAKPLVNAGLAKRNSMPIQERDALHRRP